MRNGHSKWLLFDGSGLGCDQRELRFGAVLIFSGRLDSMIINQIAQDTNGISLCPEITEDWSMTPLLCVWSVYSCYCWPVE